MTDGDGQTDGIDRQTVSLRRQSLRYA